MPDFNKKLQNVASRLAGRQRAERLQTSLFRWARKLRKPPFYKVGNFSYIKGFGFFINGWIVDPKDQVVGVSVIFQNRQTLSILDKMESVPRDSLLRKFDLVGKHGHPGFTCTVEVPELEIQRDEKVFLHINLKNGKSRKMSLKVQFAETDPLGSVRQILSAVPSVSPLKRTLFDNAYGPAISAIWSLRDSSKAAVESRLYNESLLASNPEVSLVIPIYGRYDFIEYQLSQFVNDPYMLGQEIIYVVDDPRIQNEVNAVCEAYEKIYRIPFRVLSLERNMGFAGANNIGVEHANAQLLLLINSDVMPGSAGWLQEMVLSAGSQIETTMIGARLLYEDDSIQHDGMTFHASPFVNYLWTNIHPHKGLPHTLVTANKSLMECECITGACILLKKTAFEKIGGFDENFILGDYEDSDFCMRAREIGMSIKMNSNISLYHLERQSQSLVTSENWKNEMTYYNCWYHTRKWDSAIVELQEKLANAS